MFFRHISCGRQWKVSSTLFCCVFFSSIGYAGGDRTAAPAPRVELILHNGKIWTVDENRPVAQAIAITGAHVAKVGSDREVLALRERSTQEIDLDGKLVVPGFNDAHTHFENATEWFFRVQLHGVHGHDALIRQLRETAQRVPKGFWIRGDWGIAADHGEQAGQCEGCPDLALIDAVTPDHPVLLKLGSSGFFANSKALQYARVNESTPDPRGGRYEKDPKTGELTGLLTGTAGEIVEAMLPPVSLAQRLIAARAIQQQMNSYGITSITDIARIDEMSQQQTYHTHVERSHSDVRIFQALHERGELTLRVYAMLPLTAWQEAKQAGYEPGYGDDMLRYGALKAFADNSLMLQPFSDRPGYSGGWSFRVRDEQALQRRIIEADRAGFDIGVHALGDKAVRFVLDSYEAAIAQNGARDRRLRLIHGWYSNAEDLQRVGALRLIVDVTPSHLTHEWRKVDSALGPQRSKWAHAWRQMLDAGAILNIVSDMPGGYTKGNPSPMNPLENIYYAVTRKDAAGQPRNGWHAEQALTVQEAITAYTLNPAHASREDHIKGSLGAGKLADLVVLSKDILTVPPEQLLATEVLLTVLGGKIVFEKR